jgi:hypothetical protein
MLDGQKYMHHAVQKNEKGEPVLNEKGEPVMNYLKLMKAAAIIRDDAEYDKLLIDHGISLGRKGVIDSVEHPDTNKQGGNGEPESIWGAFRNAKIS